MSRVWVVSELYYPEETSTGHFMTGIAEGLAGHFPVTALCGQPTYARRGTHSPWGETRNGVRVLRCWSFTLDKDVLPFRLLNLVSLSLSIFITITRRLRRGDVVLVVTNPPPLPLFVRLACKMRRARSVLVVHDVYPDALRAAGFLQAGSYLFALLDGLSGRVYRSMARIVVLGRDMAKLIEKKLGPGNALPLLVPNWADLDLVVPDTASGRRFLEELGLSGKFVVQYCGNMGRTHNLETIVEVAKRLAPESRVHFLFIGWGAKQSWLRQVVESSRLDNITILPRCESGALSAALNASDIAIVPMRPGMSGVSVPSRLYNIMAAGKPILAVTDSDSELGLVVEEEGIGWVVRPEAPEELEAAIARASSQPATLRAMGMRARAAAEAKYSYRAAIDKYVDLVKDLTRGS